MQIDQLPPEEQESATYCHSCLKVVNKILLGACEGCGQPICNTVGCSKRCLCGMLRDGLIDQDEFSCESFQYLVKQLAAETSPEDLKHQMEELAAEANLSPSGSAPSQRNETTDIVGQMKGILRGTDVGVSLRFRATLGN